MSRRALLGLTFLSVMFLPASRAEAVPILYNFTGNIGVSTIPGIAVGAAIAGSFAYDPDAPLLSSAPTSKLFSPTAAAIGATVGGTPYVTPVGGESFSHDIFISEFSGVPPALYDILSMAGGGPLSIAFFDADGTFFGTYPGLPATIPLAEFEYISLGIVVPDGRGLFTTANGLITVTPAAVPEPASLLLFGTGLITLARLRRRRRSTGKCDATS